MEYFCPFPAWRHWIGWRSRRERKRYFLVLLKRFTSENRNVSASPGRSYAPAIFAGEDEAKKANLRKADLQGCHAAIVPGPENLERAVRHDKSAALSPRHQGLRT